VNASGTVVSSSVYDAYGAETTSGTAPTDACGYNAQWGYWLDRDTGLYLCQARWYDPVTGRWVTRDPIGYAGGANLYGYCGGGPVGWTDNEGRYEVRLGWHQVWGDTYHAFVLVTDNDPKSKTYGWTWGFSAGPENHGAQSATNPGRVIDKSGQYNERHYDSRRWHPDLSSWPISVNCEPVAPLLRFLRNVRKTIQDTPWEYNLLHGPNSNTFAHAIVDSIGVHDGSPVRGNANRVIEDLRQRRGYSFPGWKKWQ